MVYRSLVSLLYSDATEGCSDCYNCITPPNLSSDDVGFRVLLRQSAKTIVACGQTRRIDCYNVSERQHEFSLVSGIPFCDVPLALARRVAAVVDPSARPYSTNTNWMHANVSAGRRRFVIMLAARDSPLLLLVV